MCCGLCDFLVLSCFDLSSAFFNSFAVSWGTTKKPCCVRLLKCQRVFEQLSVDIEVFLLCLTSCEEYAIIFTDCNGLRIKKLGGD